MRASVKGYCQTAGLTRKRVTAKMIQVECVGSTHGNLLSDQTMVWVWWSCDRLWVTDSRMHGGEVWCLAWPLIHRIPLLAHGLTVKHSPGPCSHSSLAGQIGACQHVGHLCLCGHLKYNLLLTHWQAHLRIMQHLSSSHMRMRTTVVCIWLTWTRIPPTLEKF